MPRMSGILLGVVTAIWALPVRAEESPFNVDFFCGWGGCYRPMEWTPVEIGIASTLETPLDAAIVLSAPQDGLNTMNITHRFVLTPEVPVNLPLVTKFAFAADRAKVSIIDRKRRRAVWSKQFDLWGRTTGQRMLTVIGQTDLLIGLVGQSKFGLLKLPKAAICRTLNGRGKVYLGSKLPRMVPWDWTGFASLDLLILYDPDWYRFNPHQLKAIARWVSNGGKLLLILGVHPLTRDNPIASLLGLEAPQAEQVKIPRKTFANLGLEPAESQTVTCWPLVRTAGAVLCSSEICGRDRCIMAVVHAGFGTAGVLGFDPATLSDNPRIGTAEFWVNRITAVLDGNHLSGAVTAKRRATSYPQQLERHLRHIGLGAGASAPPSSSGRFELGVDQLANNAVMNHLYKGIRPLSVWPVVLLLGAMALLLGPVDYIVLKRLGRLPLTWLTCAFWIGVFTVGAYYGVQYLRAGDTELRVVSVLDAIDNNSPAWSTRYCGLFAAGTDIYRFDGLDRNQWWSGISPSQENLWEYGRKGSARTIYCEQGDGANRPESLPVSIWTVQCLVNESPIERFPLEARLERRGERIVGEVTNTSGARISRGYVLVAGRKGVRLNPIPPNGTERFDRPLTSIRAWSDVDLDRYGDSYYRRDDPYGRFDRDHALFAQGSLPRTHAIDAYLAHGAAVVLVEYENAEVPFRIKSSTCKYDHIQLARLVVFPTELQRGNGK